MKKIILILLISTLVLLFIIQLWNSSQSFINTDNNNKIIISKTIKSSKYQENLLSENPKIIYIKNFINNNEMKHLISLADELKKPSTIDTRDDPAAIINDVRTSKSAHLGKSRDNIVTAIENRACEYVGLSTEYLEPMQIAVYESGQKYNPHFDFFSADSSEIIKGNRNVTVLIYLNDLPIGAGGNTFFPKLNLRIKPKAGDAIYFENMKNGEVDYSTMHAGEAIIGNHKKYAMNVWFREKSLY
jgi:prolyl 4-hydroxylase